MRRTVKIPKQKPGRRQGPNHVLRTYERSTLNQPLAGLVDQALSAPQRTATGDAVLAAARALDRQQREAAADEAERARLYRAGRFPDGGHIRTSNLSAVIASVPVDAVAVRVTTGMRPRSRK